MGWRQWTWISKGKCDKTQRTLELAAGEIFTSLYRIVGPIYRILPLYTFSNMPISILKGEQTQKDFVSRWNIDIITQNIQIKSANGESSVTQSSKKKPRDQSPEAYHHISKKPAEYHLGTTTTHSLNRAHDTTSTRGRDGNAGLAPTVTARVTAASSESRDSLLTGRGRSDATGSRAAHATTEVLCRKLDGGLIFLSGVPGR